MRQNDPIGAVEEMLIEFTGREWTNREIAEYLYDKIMMDDDQIVTMCRDLIEIAQSREASW